VVVATGPQEAVGIVTVEDILEEVVGDIAGEFEEDEPAVRMVDDDSALVRGDVRVSDVNRLLGTTLPSEGQESVEALVRKLWRETPAEGEEATAPGGDRLGIESLVGTRVWSVRVRRGRGGGPGAGPAGDSSGANSGERAA
jgi:putative hemolysin